MTEALYRNPGLLVEAGLLVDAGCSTSALAGVDDSMSTGQQPAETGQSSGSPSSVAEGAILSFGTCVGTGGGPRDLAQYQLETLFKLYLKVAPEKCPFRFALETRSLCRDFQDGVPVRNLRVIFWASPVGDRMADYLVLRHRFETPLGDYEDGECWRIFVSIRHPGVVSSGSVHVFFL